MSKMSNSKLYELTGIIPSVTLLKSGGDIRYTKPFREEINPKTGVPRNKQLRDAIKKGYVRESKGITSPEIAVKALKKPETSSKKEGGK